MFRGTGSAVHFGEPTGLAVNGMRAPQAGSGGWRQRISGVFALFGPRGLTRSRRALARTERLLEDETRLCRELNAYLMLDLCPERMPRQEFARMLCRTVATRSCFARAALLLLREPEGALRVEGSAGVDEMAVLSLNQWGLAAGEEAQGGRFLLHLERRGASVLRREVAGREGAGREGAGVMSCANMHAIPLRSAKGLLGVLVVSAEARPSVQGALTPERLQRMLEPMEALCTRVSLQLGRLGEVVVPEPRRREHTARQHGERAQTKRARRRVAERAGAASRAEHMTADQIALLAAAARSGAAVRQRQAEMLPGVAGAEMPAMHRCLPRFTAG